MCFSKVSKLQVVSEYKNAKLSVILSSWEAGKSWLSYWREKKLNNMHPYPNPRGREIFIHLCADQNRYSDLFFPKLTKLFVCLNQNTSEALSQKLQRKEM